MNGNTSRRTNHSGRRVAVVAASALTATALGTLGAAGFYLGTMDQALAKVARVQALPQAYEGQPAKASNGTNVLAMGDMRSVFVHVDKANSTIYVTQMGAPSGDVQSDVRKVEQEAGVRIDHTVIGHEADVASFIDEMGGVDVNGQHMDGNDVVDTAAEGDEQTARDVASALARKAMTSGNFSGYANEAASKVTVDEGMSNQEIRELAVAELSPNMKVVKCTSLTAECTGR